MFVKLGDEYLNLRRVVRVRFLRVQGQMQAHVELAGGSEDARVRYTGPDAEALRDALDHLGGAAASLAAAIVA